MRSVAGAGRAAFLRARVYRKAKASIAALVAVWAFFGTAPPVAAQDLTVSVAISMKEVVEELGKRFVDGRPGVTLHYNFGGSGDLQKQIEAGAPVDLFISAGERQMDDLERTRLLLPGTRRTFARNILTVIVPADSRLDLSKPADLTDPRVQRIAIGDPRTVPVGQYSEESLKALHLWDTVQPHLILAGNVRQVLEYVVRGEVDAGFVYTTDIATRRGRVKEAFRPPEGSYQRITYPVAVIKDSKYPAIARAFIGSLMGPEGRTVLTRFGFQLPPGASR